MDGLRARLVKLIRQTESRSMVGDTERLDQLAATTDDYLLKRCLWTIVLVTCPCIFIVLPFVISLLAGYLPEHVTAIIWLVAKVLMMLVFALLALTIFFTVKSDN
ncbi:MAG: hypothetical protein IPP57_10020 [Candidatus Obscuribacter sp.]|nr:hypothetical protein [Candidatus Obscuribacter sp.]